MATTSISPSKTTAPRERSCPLGDPDSAPRAPRRTLSLRDETCPPRSSSGSCRACWPPAARPRPPAPRSPARSSSPTRSRPRLTSRRRSSAPAPPRGCGPLGPVAERARIIGRIHHEAFARQDELMDLLQIEAGKARYDAFAEAAAVAVYARYVSRTAPKVLGRHARQGVVPVVTKAYEVRHPRGVVGLVTAWNYPAVFAASDGFSALVGGNAVVHRPDVAGCAVGAVGAGPGRRGRATRGPLADRPGPRALDRDGRGRPGRRGGVHRFDRRRPRGGGADRTPADLHGTRARREEPVHRAGRRRRRPRGRGRHPGLLHQRRPDLRRPRADPRGRARSTTSSAPSSSPGSSGSGWAPD